MVRIAVSLTVPEPQPEPSWHQPEPSKYQPERISECLPEVSISNDESQSTGAQPTTTAAPSTAASTPKQWMPRPLDDREDRGGDPGADSPGRSSEEQFRPDRTVHRFFPGHPIGPAQPVWTRKAFQSHC